MGKEIGVKLLAKLKDRVVVCSASGGKTRCEGRISNSEFC